MPESMGKLFARSAPANAAALGRAPGFGGSLSAAAVVAKGKTSSPHRHGQGARSPEQRWRAEASKAALPAVELEPCLEEKVDFDTFCKSRLPGVKVKACETVKKSEKLLKFTLDDGSGTDRQILSGIAKWYKPRTWWARPWWPSSTCPPEDDGPGELRYAHLRRPHREGRGGPPPADGGRRHPRRRKNVLRSARIDTQGR